MKLCSVDNCEKSAQKRGWCGMHYKRWLVHGDTATTKKAANGAGFKQDGYLGHQVQGVRKFAHVAVAEKALGRTLPPGAVVHHWDEDKLNNKPENLLICPDRAYHNLIHARMRALAASGDPAKRSCRHCKQYDDLANLRNYLTKQGGWAHWHPHCARNNAKARNKEKQ